MSRKVQLLNDKQGVLFIDGVATKIINILKSDINNNKVYVELGRNNLTPYSYVVPFDNSKGALRLTQDEQQQIDSGANLIKCYRSSGAVVPNEFKTNAKGERVPVPMTLSDQIKNGCARVIEVAVGDDGSLHIFSDSGANSGEWLDIQ